VGNAEPVKQYLSNKKHQHRTAMDGAREEPAAKISVGRNSELEAHRPKPQKFAVAFMPAGQT
jgi:hypothetical protein